MTLSKEEQIEFIRKTFGTKKKPKNHGTKKNTAKTTVRHIWTIPEEELAIDLYLNKANEAQIEAAIQGTELKLNSMKMKLGNIRFLDTGEGLENVSSLTKTLWENRQKLMARNKGLKKIA